MFKKIILMLMVMQYASFIYSFELKRNSPMSEDGRIQQKNMEMRSKSFPEYTAEIEAQERKRREASCFPPISCDYDIPYRSIDGTCNNLYHPYWGASGTPFIRFLPHQYEDGISSPRGTGRNPPLPRVRDVTAAMVSTITPTKNDGVTLMVMQWGQFTDHDLVFTPEEPEEECCADFQTATPSSSCLPIEVVGDPFYDSHNVKCLRFIRSAETFCAPGPQREQANALTSYLDGSQVYGSTPDELLALREPNSYRMSFGPGKENSSCPVDDPSYTCRTFLPVRISNETGEDEFFGGDRRVEEQPGLTSLHNIPVRMHNDLSQVIRDRNPNYSDEQVFQETRKIVSAFIQQIVFNEFLPIVIGTPLMDEYNLTLQPIGAYDPYFYDYDDYVQTNAPSGFSTASFRFGHSLIKNFYTLPGNIHVELAKSFNRHTRTTLAGTLPSHFLRGIAVDPAEELDHIIVDAIHNFLFAEDPFSFGEDLYARNIMRGRDHGIPPYPEWFNFCNPGGISNFDDLYKYMPSEVVETFNELYGGRVDDIDLWPAAMAETNAPEALLGPTFACINARFFYRVKFGDRFWFESPEYFTIPQLRAIRRTRLSNVLCQYTDADELQENIFLQVSPSNPLIKCSDLTQIGIVNDISLYW